jgi:Tfp pilus assembly protein PilP
MKISLVVLALLLAGCNETSSKVLTYDELVNYPSQCAKADAQLRELKEIQRVKNFDQDPDNLNPADRAYNSRLKASIWWYAYRCEK